MVMFESALVPVLEPVLGDEYLHITSSAAVMYRPLEPRERALCGKIKNLSLPLSSLSHLDVCFSDLFSWARFCRSCGFEVCGECLHERGEVGPLRFTSV